MTNDELEARSRVNRKLVWPECHLWFYLRTGHNSHSPFTLLSAIEKVIQFQSRLSKRIAIFVVVALNSIYSSFSYVSLFNDMHFTKFEQRVPSLPHIDDPNSLFKRRGQRGRIVGHTSSSRLPDNHKNTWWIVERVSLMAHHGNRFFVDEVSTCPIFVVVVNYQIIRPFQLDFISQPVGPLGLHLALAGHFTEDLSGSSSRTQSTQSGKVVRCYSHWFTCCVPYDLWFKSAR